MLRLLLKLAVVTAAFIGSLVLLVYYIVCAGAEGFIPLALGCPLRPSTLQAFEKA